MSAPSVATSGAVRPLCVVAGAGPGMGFAIARRFAAEGCDVALLARSAGPLEAEAERLRHDGVRALAVAADLTSKDEIAAAFDRIRAALGDPTVLVYNAARWNAGPAMEADPDVFAADLDLAVVGALTCVRQVHPAMRSARGGTVLFTGGGLALRPEFGAGVASLAAGKAALRALAFVLAAELAADDVRVATVTIAGTVARGTPFDPEVIAGLFWEAHVDRHGPVERVFDGRSSPSPRTA